MRLTKFYCPTIKEAPAEAEVISQQLMIRAGMIRKLAAGIYTLLPMGLKVIRKVENIIRQEMDREGAMEVFMPSIQPAELWIESGRWEFYGKELLRIKDRHDREFCYGPTHEEVVTDLVRRDVRSYRNLPVNLYQIQTKFRDEIRPRFGVMRGREFSMKDAYSFDATDEGANASYEAMRRAYYAIFGRMGLKFRAVEADTGQIGGSFSHEFMVLAESGEDVVVFCDSCQYAANMEKVECVAPAPSTGDMKEIAEVNTPGKGSIEDVAEFLTQSPASFIKTLILKSADGELIAALTRGDHSVNEVKLKSALGGVEAVMAEDGDVVNATGAPVGFAGPVGLKIKVVADNAVKGMINAVTGANKKNTHITGVNPLRDFPGAVYADIRNAVEGDQCPRCSGGKMKMARGIEVGHVFKLGTKYSKAMKAQFLDNEGKEQAMIMGCYGIGVGRSAAAAIEQNHDAAGIIWPPSIAPFKVAVLPLNMDDAAVIKAAEDIYSQLEVMGAEPVLDDRDLRPGFKFNDADLIGYPIQVVVGKKGLAGGNVEIKVRKTGEKKTIPLADAAKTAIAELEQLSAPQ